MSSICLCMIVKNEAHCIKRCLESVRPFISHYVICDTGSIDNTIQVIKETLHDIPGQVYQNEWKDFSSNRNLAILGAKSKADYILMIDADDHLEGTIPNNLDAPVYNVMFKHGSITYTRPQLWHTILDARYKGVLHEYLELPAVQSKNLVGAHIVFGGSGSRSHDPNKFIKDCITFENAMPLSPRDTFYYAQSLRDSGLHQQSIFQYLKRAKMKDWNQEVYISYLEAAKMYERLNPNDSETIESMYLKAYTTIPQRAEALHYLGLYWRHRDQFSKAYTITKLGLSISAHEGLFIENACYQWKMKDEFSVAAIYVGRGDEAKPVIEQMLREGFVPEHERARLENNLKYC